jgi:hypothetical protein
MVRLWYFRPPDTKIAHPIAVAYKNRGSDPEQQHISSTTILPHSSFQRAANLEPLRDQYQELVGRLAAEEKKLFDDTQSLRDQIEQSQVKLSGLKEKRGAMILERKRCVDIVEAERAMLAKTDPHHPKLSVHPHSWISSTHTKTVNRHHSSIENDKAELRSIEQLCGEEHEVGP